MGQRTAEVAARERLEKILIGLLCEKCCDYSSSSFLIESSLFLQVATKVHERLDDRISTPPPKLSALERLKKLCIML